MRKNKRYRHWIIRNADILERKESGTVRRRKKKRIMIGEKVIGAGFFSIPLHGFGAGWPRMEDSFGRSDYRRGNYENRSGYSKNGGIGICVVFA